MCIHASIPVETLVGADPGCSSAEDNSESPNPECSDGIDNDLDGAIDGFDAGCSSNRDDEEGTPECSDGVNNDAPDDTLVDFPNDPGCSSPSDNSEDPDDSDGDGLNDAEDNCPAVANAGQADRDEDGRGNVCDACPRLSASSPNGCPNISRSLTLDYSRGAFRGRLSARKAACYRDKPVIVWEKVGTIGGSDDVRIGRDMTNDNGRYAVPEPRRPGQYYSVAPERTISTVGNCRFAMSAVLRL